MKSNSLACLDSHDKLKLLAPVIESWFDTLARFQASEEDLPWAYGERASLSLLAGAAWRTPGWVAIEEFRTDKRTAALDPKTSSVGNRYGRCDLYLSNGETSFAIEAKQTGQPIGEEAGKANFSRAFEAHREAWEDAGALFHDEGDVRVALTFVVPSFRPTQTPYSEQEPSAIASWLSELPALCAKEGIHGLAYYFPETARDLLDVADRRFLPGVAALFQVRSRAARGISGKAAM